MMRSSLVYYAVLFITLSLLAGCSDTPVKPDTGDGGRHEIQIQEESEPKLILGPPIPSITLAGVNVYPTEFSSLSGWNKDNHAAAYSSFQRSCQRWRSQPTDKPLTGIVDFGRVGDWLSLCAMPVSPGQEKQFFERWFKPYAVQDSNSFEGLFTGYYIPELHGSRQRSSRYNVPIYRVPSDLGKRKPYYDRAQIEDGALEGKGFELLWVDDPVDAFFMEVQGSGRVLMEEGYIQGLSYAGKNGHAYFAIGKALVDSGEIAREDISMQTIRAWIDKHPVEGRNLMRRNRSYVFFRLSEVKPNTGPIGAMSVPLTAERSLAVDLKTLPLGIPVWLDAEHPAGGARLKQLVMAQDTGGAIKGVIRGDLYWGEGDRAGEMAGPMKSKGRYFILLPRSLDLEHRYERMFGK